MVVSAKDFELFLNRLNSGLNGFSEVIVPRKVSSPQNKTAVLRFEKLKENNETPLNSYRTIDPLKFLFYLTREKVYPVDGVLKKRVIVGVKACDLKALILLDKAMLEGGFTDPAYYNWRKNTLIISCDCDEICETCHCNLVGGKPYSEKGFDINLSRVNNHYVITTGSEQGISFLDLLKEEIPVQNSSTDDAKTISEKRSHVLNLLQEQNRENERPSDYSEFRKVETKVWKQESEECVGCGACTNICPTCYCLILNDESIKEQFVKVRGYDSCQWFGYARVAGGGSPRHKMTERFRNRYLCKFDYMNHNFGEIGCTGCGRCTEACAGQIDFRKVVKNISKAVLQKS